MLCRRHRDLCPQFGIRYVLPSRNVAVLTVKLDNKRFARDVVLKLQGIPVCPLQNLFSPGKVFRDLLFEKFNDTLT